MATALPAASAPLAEPCLILASASPRRRDLLAQIGINPAGIRPSDIDESPKPREKPRDLALRLAREKAEAAMLAEGEIVLAADTIVALGRRSLGKPGNTDEARAFLRLLSGRRHQVTTGIAVRNSTRLWQRAVTTSVRFKQLSEAEIDSYIKSGEWQGKAGGYAIQGIGAAFVPWISGSYSNVVGLPLTETRNLLMAAGLPVALA
ncbi:Maf family protein [Amaricoccus macauensis]|uniref:Maf family protein n=1 Tax=Amaricoccus macauensis TaxID=57001 RepID=UPI003C798059